MSRIEKALEKATRLRDNRSSAFSPAGKRAEKESAVTVENISPYAATLHEPDSPVSEEYRKLKSMVVRLTKQGGFKNTLAVMSAVGGEGKSITALNLAVALSREYDHTVLLVDADLRNPALHDYFGTVPEAGLSDCLADGLDMRVALLDVGKGGFAFLPSGRKAKNPAELLSSLRMKELLAEMKHRYSDRYVIIDTPPLLPFAEAFSIGSMVDGVVFVVRAGAASRDNVRDALDVLKDCNVLGVVYNDAGAENPYGRYACYSSRCGKPAEG